MRLISTVTVGAGGAASIDFTSIPQGYTDLLVVMSLRDTSGSSWSGANLTFNGSSTGYSGRNLYGTGAGAGSDTYAFGGAGIYVTSATAANTANTFSNCSIYIANYAGSANKSASVDSVNENNSSSAQQHLNAVLWSNTSAITRVTITASLVQYSTASLYGITRGNGGATVA